MFVKVIVTCLISSYGFLSALDDYLKITENEYAKFEGGDPAKYCGNCKYLTAVCNVLGKSAGYTDGTAPFLEGYPACNDTKIVLQGCAGGVVLKPAKVVVCGWSEDQNFIIGKGRAPHAVMNYKRNTKEGISYPIQDIPGIL